MAEYNTLAELADWGIKADAFVDETADKKRQAIRAISDKIDGYLRAQYTLPMLTVGEDIKRCCAILSSIDLIRNIGVSPEDGEDLDRREKNELDWLRMIAAGTVIPAVTDSSPGAAEGAPARRGRVVSATSRGFSVRGTADERGPFQGD